MITSTEQDLVPRFKRAKEKLENFQRSKMETEAKKKAIEEQVASLVAELKTLDIDPANLRSTVDELQKRVTEKLTEVEAAIETTEKLIRG